MTFENRKGPDESQFCRQTVPSLRSGNSEGAVTDGCKTCGRHQNFSRGRRTQPTSRRRKNTSDSG